MDLLTIKQGISSADVCISEKAEQPIDIEFSLPDYCPEIDKIIKCTLTPRISNVSYSGSTVTAEGEAVVSILYCAAGSGELFGYETEVPFSKSADTGYDCEKAMIKADATPDYINCRAVNERKLEIHGALTLFFSGECNKDTDIVTGSECDKLQTMKRHIDYVGVCGYCAKQFMLEEEVELPQTCDSIENILRTSADVTVSDCRFAANKAIVKGELCINVLYRSVKKNCECYSGTIPFEQMIDIDGANDDCVKLIDALVCSFKVKTYTDTDGECRSMLISAKVNVDLKACSVENMDIISDCYSVTNEINVERSTLDLRCYAEEIHQTHSLREMLDFPQDSLARVVDVCCEAGDVHTTFDGNMMKISGMCAVSVVAVNLQNECLCYDKNVPFEHECTVAECDKHEAEIKAYVSGCSYSIKSSAALEIRCQIDITGCVYCKMQLPVITDILSDDGSEKPIVDMPALILYYAKAGDSIWKIAMHYNTAADKIMSVNGLENDVLSENKILMIPGI